MKIIIDGEEMEVAKIKQTEFYDLLKEKVNLFLFGKSGWGKSQIVKRYCEENGLKLKTINIASKLPEAIGGIPYAKQPNTDEIIKKLKEQSKELERLADIITKLNIKLTETTIANPEDTTTILSLIDRIKTFANKQKAIEDDQAYYKELLGEDLKEVFDDDGEGWVIFFDEMNQGLPEVFNTLYSPCYPMGEDRNWCGHSLSKAQIVACANLSDGSDGVTYLNDLPTPLLNRFFVYELQCSKTDAKNYLKKKYKNIPQVVKYIDVILDAGKSPRTTDLCLDILQYEKNGLLLQSKLGTALTTKILDIQKKVKTADPAKTLKLCRQSYEIFKEDGIVQWAGEEIETEEELLDKFSEILSEEEIKSIVKGEE